MSLNKAIKYKKEHRQEYRHAKRFLVSCRNHGYCPWCQRNRLYSSKVQEEKSKDELKEFLLNNE